jgi:hypothetical protein
MWIHTVPKDWNQKIVSAMTKMIIYLSRWNYWWPLTNILAGLSWDYSHAELHSHHYLLLFCHENWSLNLLLHHWQFMGRHLEFTSSGSFSFCRIPCGYWIMTWTSYLLFNYDVNHGSLFGHMHLVERWCVFFPCFPYLFCLFVLCRLNASDDFGYVHA